MLNRAQFQIRDPIHGVIFISEKERTVIDSLVFQRLRNIKQVGFLDFAFPCASHSRYCHSLGTMSVATKIFERVLPMAQMEAHLWMRLRQTVRLAALLHDIGHPPLSHTTEMLMPMLNEVSPDGKLDIRATHEDFTQRIILDSPLTELLIHQGDDLGIIPAMIAGLLGGAVKDGWFVVKGKDYTPILRQIISSEVDADRMDYLLRDSFFCGVNYGKFDSDWLIDNLVKVERGSQVFLGLRDRAIFALEDFLLSRFHMFASVYLHHTPVVMEKMLENYFKECPQDFHLPTDIARYLELNDFDLWQALRLSENRWAQRIVQRRPYVKVHESMNKFSHGIIHEPDFERIIEAMTEKGIGHIASRSIARLSTYCGKGKSPLFVENSYNKVIALEEFSPLFDRYQLPLQILRIYVEPQERHVAQSLLLSLNIS